MACATYGVKSTCDANATRIHPDCVKSSFVCEMSGAVVMPIWHPARSMLMIANRGLGQQQASATGGKTLSTAPRFTGILARDRWPHGAAAPVLCESP